MDRAEAEAIFDAGRGVCAVHPRSRCGGGGHGERLRRLEEQARRDSRTSSKPRSTEWLWSARWIWGVCRGDAQDRRGWSGSNRLGVNFHARDGLTAGFRAGWVGRCRPRGRLMLVVSGAGAQVMAGSARIASRMVVKSCCQGQRAGIRSVHWRLLRVSRAGTARSWWRRERAVWTGAFGSPIWLVQRPRLCASAAITVQALFACMRPEGK